MKVLIVENEIYLAQSIATKLESLGYRCQIVSTIQEAMEKPKSEIILLSVIRDSLCEVFIRQNPQAIVIMMISYASEETMTKPLKAGAKDYIMKPFMLDELLRKVEHQLEHQRLQRQILFYEEYFSFLEEEMGLPALKNYYPPFVIACSNQRIADLYAIKFAKEKKMALKFVRLFDLDEKICSDRDVILYITHLEHLKKNELKDFLRAISDKNVIASIITSEEIDFSCVIDLRHQVVQIEGDIISLKDYEKSVIERFEGRYSDMELAKKMGISRKNLWEKRKRYGLERKKENTNR